LITERRKEEDQFRTRRHRGQAFAARLRLAFFGRLKTTDFVSAALT